MHITVGDVTLDGLGHLDESKPELMKAFRKQWGSSDRLGTIYIKQPQDEISDAAEILIPLRFELTEDQMLGLQEPSPEMQEMDNELEKV